MLDYSTL